MSRNGIGTTLIIATAAVVFVPVFADAANQSFSNVTYGTQLSLVVEQFPLLLALIALVSLAALVVKW